MSKSGSRSNFNDSGLGMGGIEPGAGVIRGETGEIEPSLRLLFILLFLCDIDFWCCNNAISLLVL